MDFFYSAQIIAFSMGLIIGWKFARIIIKWKEEHKNHWFRNT